ncbi:MAG: protein kinase [Candidatus Hydrogenedentota bacterium]
MTQIECPTCGTSNPPNQTHCEQCNAPLSAEGPKQQGQPAGSGGRPNQASRKKQPHITFPRGKVLANRYTIIEMIGRGGMGCIYKAHDNVLNEEVALKMLLPQFVRDKVVVNRFYNEARIARKLAHPNIVRVHDIGMTEGVLYISMEYLRGRSLRSLIEHQGGGQWLSVEMTLRMADGICEALEYAHQYTVHRDIKPENVMIGDSGEVKIMDFGISKLMAKSNLTATSMVMGTPHYMSPEQFKDSRSVDGRADIYSLGVLIYEMLTGGLPTGMGKPLSAVRSDASPELETIVIKCTEKEPENRYQSVHELRQALQPLLNRDHAAPFGKAGVFRGARPWARRAAGVLLAAAMLALAGWGLWQAEEHRRMAVVEAQAEAADPPPEASEAPGPKFTLLRELTEEAMSVGRDRAEGDERLEHYLGMAEQRWERAATAGHAGRSPEALQLGWEGLQYALGVALRPEGMVFIPPGHALLNAETGEGVVLPGFFMDRTEVTMEAYREFSEDTGWRTAPNSRQWPGEYPVTRITLYDAMAYAAWADKRLPTDAEWARAAVGDTRPPAPFPWGAEWEEEAANMGTGELAPVGVFEMDETPYGVLDMAGNVSEWTRTPTRPRDQIMPTAEGDSPEEWMTFGVPVVVRGGNFQRGAALASRFAERFEAKRTYVGFRCVKALPAGIEEIRNAL